MTWQDVLTGDAKWSVEQADCLSWLAQLPPDSVDLIFTSPPYEKARLYLEDGTDMKIARDTESWVAWLVEVIQAASRVCRGLVAFVVEGQTRNYRWTAGPALLMADLHRAGLCLRKPPAFHRVGIPGSGGPDWLRNDYEFIVCCTRQGKLPWSDTLACGRPPKFGPGGQMSYRNIAGERCNERARTKTRTDRRIEDRGLDRENVQVYTPPAKANPGNVIACKVGGGLMGHELAHENEAPYPLSLCEFFVRSFCPPGGIVADCFGGSFTTGHAALLHGRRFIGCDIRDSQVTLGNRRLSGITPSLPFTEAGGANGGK